MKHIPLVCGRTSGSVFSPVISPQKREELILEHLPQVRLIARRIHERIPRTISLDDLISAGVVGLISAIDRYDARHDVKLKTYAEYKIRGAILDSLRNLDWAPRQQRRRARLIENAISALEQEHQRVPEDQEIAAHLALSLPEYHEWLSEARGMTLGSLESAGGDEEGGLDLLRFVADSDQNWPSEILERAELERTVAQCNRTDAQDRTHRLKPLLLRGNDAPRYLQSAQLTRIANFTTEEPGHLEATLIRAQTLDAVE